MGWLITRSPDGNGFTRVFADGLGVPLMDVVLDLAKLNQPMEQEPSITSRKLSVSEIRRRNTIERNETMRRLHTKGWTVPDLANRFGISEKTVYGIVSRGKVRKPGRGSNLSPESEQRRDEMRKLFSEGKTKEEIGKIYGISRERVRQIIGNGRGNATQVRHQKAKKKILAMVETHTIEEISQQLDLSTNTISRITPGMRYKIKEENLDSSVGKGDEWERRISEKLSEFGLKNELMPRRHPFDILVEGKVRIDVKSRHSVGTDKRGYRFCSFSLKKPENFDFAVLVITELDEFYIVPTSGNISHTIRFQIPPVRVSKYDKYKEAWGLIWDFMDGKSLDVPQKQPMNETVKHGTNTMYQRGCRCNDCKEAGRAYRLKRQAKNETRDDGYTPPALGSPSVIGG